MIIKKWAKWGFLGAISINIISMIGASLTVSAPLLNDLFIAFYFLTILISGVLAAAWTFLSLKENFDGGITKKILFLILSLIIGLLSSCVLYIWPWFTMV
jgi:hypothetical protein